MRDDFFAAIRSHRRHKCHAYMGNMVFAILMEMEKPITAENDRLNHKHLCYAWKWLVGIKFLIANSRRVRMRAAHQTLAHAHRARIEEVNRRIVAFARIVHKLEWELRDFQLHCRPARKSESGATGNTIKPILSDFNLQRRQ